MAKTQNFAEAIRATLAKDSQLSEAVEQERINADIAVELFNAREEAGLTQKQLAELIGSHQSVIARMECSDYDGHSIAMLHRIAKALKKRVRVEFYSPCELILKEETSFPVEAPKWSNTVWDAAMSVKRVYSKSS